MSLLLTLALALQSNDNPEWPYWKSMKVGSTVKYKMEMSNAGQSMEGEMTRTLLEIGAEKAVVERKGRITVNGQTVDMPADKDEVKPKDDKPTKILKDTSEEIEVAGKKLKCRYVETEKEEEGEKISAKIWAHEDIPGGVAKMDVKTPGGGSMKLTALAWEKK